MKITKTVLLAFLITLINVSSVLGDTPGPPPPTSTSRSAGLPPPPGGTIDQNLMVLLIAALFFGIYTIYRYNINKKASI